MSIIDNLDKAFDHRIRLGIMSVLMVNDYADFRTLKEQLNATDGNLASHLKALEKSGYIAIQKSFIDRKPNTKYSVSKLGSAAFKKHINALEKLLGN